MFLSHLKPNMSPCSPNLISHKVLLTPVPDTAHVNPYALFLPSHPLITAHLHLCSKHTITPQSSALTPSNHLCKSLPMIFLEKIDQATSMTERHQSSEEPLRPPPLSPSTLGSDAHSLKELVELCLQLQGWQVTGPLGPRGVLPEEKPTK